MLVQSFTDRLRPLVGIKSWDYIVLWKIGNDNRSIELMDCCCAGIENVENGGDDLGFQSAASSSSATLPCRDVMFPHPRVKSCDLLDLIPSSMVLDSGVHAQALLSNQASWLNYSHNSDASLSQEAIGTRVLIPLSLGLLELFVAKQVSEDQEVIDCIRVQSSIFLEHQTMSNNSDTTHTFSSDLNAQKEQISLFQHQISSPDHSKENLDLPNDICIDRIHLCTSPLNSNGIFMEGPAYESSIFTSSMENTFQEVEATQSNMMSNASRGSTSRWMEPSGAMEDQMHDDSFVCENTRSDESDPNEDDDDPKYRRRTGKGPQSKNLVAERKRRKKLNDKLYALRALVPNISKLDRASILGDAIEFVKELQKQAEDLKVELEEHSDDEDNARNTAEQDGNDSSIPPSVTHENGTKRGPKREHESFVNGYHMGSSCNNNKLNLETDSRNKKVQQMEPQVEVFQVNGNEFFVKVFCEHKSGGFVRLVEELNALGLEVANVNTTRHTCLASSIFKIERKNNETVEADDVKESLLEVTRNPSGMWPNNSAAAAAESESNDIDGDYSMNHSHNHHALHNSCQMNSHHHQH